MSFSLFQPCAWDHMQLYRCGLGLQSLSYWFIYLGNFAKQLISPLSHHVLFHWVLSACNAKGHLSITSMMHQFVRIVKKKSHNSDIWRLLRWDKSLLTWTAWARFFFDISTYASDWPARSRRVTTDSLQSLGSTEESLAIQMQCAHSTNNISIAWSNDLQCVNNVVAAMSTAASHARLIVDD